MDFDQLARIVFDEMKPKLESNQSLGVFARERAKFEGWLKVELCESLLKHFNDVTPEKNRTDVTFEDWAIELKTPNTNYRFPGVIPKHRPITNNTQGIIDDIQKLRSSNFANKAVLFVVFPAVHGHPDWQNQLSRITRLLSRLEYEQFRFKGDIPGIIYFGSV